MQTETTPKKPGPAPVYGERKVCTTRMEPALVERLRARFAIINEKRRREGQPELSFSEGLAQLAEWALGVIDYREKKNKVTRPTPTVKPAPVVVSITVEELAPVVVESPPPSSSAATALWGEIQSRIRSRIGQEPFEEWFATTRAASLERCRLVLHVPNPFFLISYQEKGFAEFIEGIAAEVTDQPIKVVLAVSPDYARRQAEDEARAEGEKARRDQAEAAHKARATKLTTLYTKGGYADAKEAGRLIVEDETLLSLLPVASRKLITDWIHEAEFRAPKNRGRG